MSVTRYSDYDPFAKVYNRHWSFFATKAYAIADHLVLRHLPRNCAVLDLCCGTGQLAARLVEQGYKITGIDGSEQMIEIARKKAPDAEFLVSDAREFSVPKKFNAAFSTFDSLNHVMTLEELERVFRSVYEALEGGGYFEFDLNMEDAYLARWGGSRGHVEDDHVFVVRTSRDEKQRIGKTEFTIFELDRGNWNRSDSTLLQRWYSESEVKSAFQKAGFDAILTFDGKDPIAEGLSRHEGRMFFVARKP